MFNTTSLQMRMQRPELGMYPGPHATAPHKGSLQSQKSVTLSTGILTIESPRASYQEEKVIYRCQERAHRKEERRSRVEGSYRMYF